MIYVATNINKFIAIYSCLPNESTGEGNFSVNEDSHDFADDFVRGTCHLFGQLAFIFFFEFLPVEDIQFHIWKTGNRNTNVRRSQLTRASSQVSIIMSNYRCICENSDAIF